MKIELNVPSLAVVRHAARGGILDLSVQQSDEAPWIAVDGDRRPLWMLERASRLPPHLAEAVPKGWVGLIIGRNIPKDERTTLERDSLSWWDLNGSLHVDLGDRVIRIEGTTSARGPADSARQRRLGPLGTRAAQELLSGARGERWSVNELAERSGVSVGQAHNVLASLEGDGVVESVGRGPSKRRIVLDENALLEWLRRSESLLRRPTGVFSYLYARNEMDLARRAHRAMTDVGVRYAVTSALGSRLWGVPVVTSAITQIRVASSDLQSLRTMLSLPELDADEAGRGANLELWTDTGAVGTHSAVERDGVMVAPQSRVYLDLVRLGGRYAEGAELLREKLLD
ncbi:hypothetical protein EDF22_0253 [Rathayibacter sp. PhB127]|uniref:helix-turn-helix domain-containing protein n=1 Tax=Rathayibacter sp. PhB127 TaxID=2485176 RepID=UPI000F4CCDA2|nr:helix-turn-helix domain-containing protein [Rathayibacter sp. PhB127]ROS28528.1 hypothetical protein EDF22_0253 [Rathayibacter sp. PhB127]